MNNIHSFNSLNENFSGNANRNNNTNLQVGAASNENNEINQGCLNCLKKILPNFRFKSFCFTIIIVNCVIYISEIILYNIQSNEEWGCTLYNMGAKFSPAIKHNFQFQRLFLPIFLHANFVHLFFNSLSIIFLGFYIENFLGTFKTVILYFVSGFLAGVLSCVLDISNTSVGASGSIMGFSGFYIFFYIIYYKYLSQHDKYICYIFVVLTVMNLFQTSNGKGDKIDMFSHIGGFTAGFLLSILLIGIEQIKDPSQINLIKKLKIISLISLLAIGLTLFSLLFFILHIPANFLNKLC